MYTVAWRPGRPRAGLGTVEVKEVHVCSAAGSRTPTALSLILQPGRHTDIYPNCIVFGRVGKYSENVEICEYAEM